MKIYKDKELTQETTILDFGIVDAGDTKTFNFYIVNNSLAYLRNLVFRVNHEEIKILESPTELDSNASGELVLEWSPSVTIKQGLKAVLNINAQEIWG